MEEAMSNLRENKKVVKNVGELSGAGTDTSAGTEEQGDTGSDDAAETEEQGDTGSDDAAGTEEQGDTGSDASEVIEVAPDPPGDGKTTSGGNWGLVTLIVLLIAALGAGIAVLLLRNKGKGKKGQNPYRNAMGDSTKTEIVGESVSASSISCGMAQTVGKREEQQDSLYCSNWKDPGILMTRGLLAAVADGIGGLKDGNLASQNAMQGIRAVFQEGNAGQDPPDRLLACAAEAQKRVLKLNQSTNCGATLVSVLITGKSMYLLSIGDSRIYLYRAGALLQLNREHILRRQNEENEKLYGTGEQLTRKRAGALTSFLGRQNLTLIDRTLSPMQLLPGDRIALMSDGVFNTLSEQEIITHLRKNPETAAREMIQDVDAHDHPGQDNASVVVIGIA